MSAVLQSKMTIQDYLAWENDQVEKHEYWQGETYAMVGARRVHGLVVSNLVRHLGNALAGSPCRVFSEAMKVQVADDGIFYPDVFVTCDQADLRTDQVFRSPTLVIEILSPSTQGYDRSRKFAAYRRIASLQEYLLVDPDTRRIEAFRPGADGLWDLHDHSDAAHVEIASLGCRLEMAEIWDGVDPPADR